MSSIGMLNGGRTIIALIDICHYAPEVSQIAYNPKGPEKLPGKREVPTMSSLCASSSSLLAMSAITSTLYLPMLLFRMTF